MNPAHDSIQTIKRTKVVHDILPPKVYPLELRGLDNRDRREPCRQDKTTSSSIRFDSAQEDTFDRMRVKSNCYGAICVDSFNIVGAVSSSFEFVWLII